MRSPNSELITTAAVRQICGGISKSALWRWRKTLETGFPPPIVIAGRTYWRRSDVLAWIEQKAEAGRAGEKLSRPATPARSD